MVMTALLLLQVKLNFIDFVIHHSRGKLISILGKCGPRFYPICKSFIKINEILYFNNRTSII